MTHGQAVGVARPHGKALPQAGTPAESLKLDALVSGVIGDLIDDAQVFPDLQRDHLRFGRSGGQRAGEEEGKDGAEDMGFRV